MCPQAHQLPETNPLAAVLGSWGNDSSPAQKADSFGSEPCKGWLGPVRETSSDRSDQYPRPLRCKWLGHFQGERDAPMSGGLELPAVAMSGVWLVGCRPDLRRSTEREAVRRHNGSWKPTSMGESWLCHAPIRSFCRAGRVSAIFDSSVESEAQGRLHRLQDSRTARCV
jgi:hypothetical protein